MAGFDALWPISCKIASVELGSAAGAGQTAFPQRIEQLGYAPLGQFCNTALTASCAGLSRERAVQGEEAAPRRQGRERMDRFLCGLAAGMVAKLGTHPLDVAKKRFQVCHAGLNMKVPGVS